MESVKKKASRFLLDTHALLWWLFDDPRLSRPAYDIIQEPDNKILVSSASGWEIATKYRLGKLPHAGEAADNLPSLLHRSRMTFYKLPWNMLLQQVRSQVLIVILLTEC